VHFAYDAYFSPFEFPPPMKLVIGPWFTPHPTLPRRIPRVTLDPAGTEDTVSSGRAVPEFGSTLGLGEVFATMSVVTVRRPQHLNADGSRKSFQQVLSSAGASALRGGLPGMAAMGVQVLSLMWLRTTVNYQYRYGTSTRVALSTLYKDGGIRRFYRGLLPALIQGPLARFGDTAANSGMLALLDGNEATANVPVAFKTLSASAAAATFRIALMPIDACKTILQVEGKNGIKLLGAKVLKGGPQVFFHGALAASAATFVGHYPWFFTQNYLQERVPKPEGFAARLVRNALIGFCSSAVSDTCSNSIRVIKTTKQAATNPMTYGQALRSVVEKDGYAGLFGRGLGTKLISNGLQGMMFTVLWKMGEDYLNEQERKEKLKAEERSL